MGAVFIDLDGTLCDSAHPISESIAFALRQIGLDAPEATVLQRYIGPPLIETFISLGAPDPHEALGHYRAHYTSGGMLNAPVYDGVFDALKRMRTTGRRLYLMTAKPHIYARKITKHLGLTPYLKREFGPEIDGTFDDKADLLKHALAETQEEARNSVMVGDRANDLRAGKAVGMPVIAALWGFGSAEEMAGADVFLDHPINLPDAVDTLI